MPENGEKWQFFFNSRFLYRIDTFLIIGLDKGNQKGPLSKHFFLFLMLFLTSSMDHMKFQSNWLWKKISKVKVYMKGTVGNDMFIRMAEPPLLVKFQNSLQPTWKLLSLSKCLLVETRANLEGHMVLWCNGLAFKNHFKMFFS